MTSTRPLPGVVLRTVLSIRGTWGRRPTAIACALGAALVLGGCSRHATAPTPIPDPAVQVTPIDQSGPIRMTFVDASIPPGTTVTGCGPLIDGCAGRLRMRFLLIPPADGPVLYARVYLHATTLLACLWGETAPFTVRAGTPLGIEIGLDRAESCRAPTTIATMAVVVEGPSQVASRQTWSLHYVFAP